MCSRSSRLGYHGTIDQPHEPSVALLQAAARESGGLHRKTHSQLAEVQETIAALGPDRLVAEEHTRRAAEELSAIRKRRAAIGVEQARRQIRALVTRLDAGDLRHATSPTRDEAVYWAARLHAGSREAVAEARAYKDRLRASGTDIDLRIVDALAAETEGDGEGALGILSGADGPDIRATLLSILREVRGDQEALAWFDAEPNRDEPCFLTGIGWSNLAVCLGNAGRWDEAAGRLAAARDVDLAEWPDLAFVEGVVNTALLLPDDARRFAFNMDLFRPTLRTVEGPEADERRTRATECFARAAALMDGLGCPDRAEAARDRQLWLRLTSPDLAIVRAAREEVTAGMGDEDRAPDLMPFAHAFDVKFDPEVLHLHLARQRRLGGLRGRDLFAELLLVRTVMSPGERAEFLMREEDRLIELAERGTLVGMRIEALLEGGRTVEAQQLLADRRADLAGEDAERFRLWIEAEAGNDPRPGLERLYDQNGELINLRNLANHLFRIRDWGALRPRLEELFRRERTAENARDLVRCMRRDPTAGEAAVVAFLEANGDLAKRDCDLAADRAWALFHVGRLEQARAINDRLLAGRDEERDLWLDLNIALQSGDWERFPAIVEREWAGRQARGPEMLLRLASLAAQADATAERVVELARLAAEKAPDDPQVLVTAYSLATQVGREDEADPGWLERALRWSSGDGPVWTADMRTLVEEMMPRRREQVEKDGRRWTRGELPIHFASAAFRAPLSRLLLDVPRRNAEERDGRRRTVIPILSGARQPVEMQPGWTVGLDLTSAMVLAHLGLLRPALKVLHRVALAPETMVLLLNDRRQAFFHQPSRVSAAEEVCALIDQRESRLKLADPLPTAPAWLVEEVGDGLAGMLEAACTDGGRVVRPSPIPKLRSFMEQETDLKEYGGLVLSTVAFVRLLRDAGHLDTATFERGERYLRVHDRVRGRDAAPDAAPMSGPALLERPVYLDNLAVNYLQSAGVLRRACAAGLDLRVHPTLREEQAALVEANRGGAALARRVDDVRSALREALLDRRAVFLPRHHDVDEERLGELSGAAVTLAQFVHDAGPCDAVCLDDRCLNQHATFEDRAGRLVPLVCVLDVLRFLRDRREIDEAERLAALHALREGGFALVSVEADELEGRLRAATAGADGSLTESAELRAIRQNLMRLCGLDAVSLPGEEAYLAGLRLAAISAVRRLWADEAVAIERAVACTDWAWRHVSPSPADWAHAVRDPAAMLPAREGLVRHLWLWLAPMPLVAAERYEAFRRWVEDVVLEPLLPASVDVVDALAAHVATEIEQFSREFADDADGDAG